MIVAWAIRAFDPYSMKVLKLADSRGFSLGYLLSQMLKQLQTYLNSIYYINYSYLKQGELRG